MEGDRRAGERGGYVTGAIGRPRDWRLVYGRLRHDCADLPVPQWQAASRGAIRSAATRWIGENRSGYSNATVDRLLDRAAATINPTERTAVLGELVQAQFADLAVLPLFWGVSPVLQLKGVRSHETASLATTWNFFEFDKE